MSENRISVFKTNRLLGLGGERWRWRAQAENNRIVFVPGEDFVSRMGAYNNIRLTCEFMGGDPRNLMIYENGVRMNQYGTVWEPEVFPSESGRSKARAPRKNNAPKKIRDGWADDKKKR